MPTVQTTLKTDSCSFSEYRIYPGHGKRFVSKDGKLHIFITKKCEKIARHKTKPIKIRWTQAWRRKNKKMKAELTQKKKGPGDK